MNLIFASYDLRIENQPPFGGSMRGNEKWFEKADIWPELNLMEVEMNFDSLIFQNAEECFIDPADQQWFEERGIKTKYQISYDTGDIEAVREVLHNIMAALGGRICSDTDDFEPSCTADTLDKLI